MKYLQTITWATILCFFVSNVRADVIYNDGGVHDVNSNYSGNVGHIYNSSEGDPTTVNVFTGGSFDELYAHNQSFINFYDGTVNQMLGARNYSTVKIYDGWIDKIGVNSVDSGNAKVEIFGGSTTDLRTQGGESYVRGGSLLRITADSSSWISISGGSVGGVFAYGNSEVEIKGGLIGELDCDKYSTSTITVYGTDFNYAYGEIDASFGNLKGTLLNGTLIDANFYIHSQDAKIILVPEPSTFLLLSLGLVALRKQK